MKWWYEVWAEQRCLVITHTWVVLGEVFCHLLDWWSDGMKFELRETTCRWIVLGKVLPFPDNLQQLGFVLFFRISNSSSVALLWEYGTNSCHHVLYIICIFIVSVHFLFLFFKKLVSINQTMPACPSFVYFFDMNNTEGTNSLKICVWCLCMSVLFYACVWVDFYRFLFEKASLHVTRRVLNGLSLTAEFDHLSVTLCS